MGIGSRIARVAGAVVRHAEEAAWRPLPWLRRHRWEFMAVAVLALMLAPLLL